MTPEEVLDALAGSPGFITITDTFGIVQWASRYAYGYTANQVVGTSGDDTIDPTDREEFALARRRAASTGEIISGTLRLLPPDGGLPVPMGYRMQGRNGLVVIWCWEIGSYRVESHAWSASEKRILASVTSTPQSARALARISGLTYNSHLRVVLARLVDVGAIRHSRRGYSLPLV